MEDKLFFGFFILTWMLGIRSPDVTVTSFMRSGFLLVIGTAVPYLAFSRYIASREEMNRIMLAFLIPVFIYGVIGMFELAWHWSLYGSPPSVWGLDLGKGSSVREGLLRANGPIGHGSPIVFGSFFVVASGFLLALAPGRGLWLSTGVIWGGLISTLSRGPWVGTSFVYFVYWLTSSGKTSKAFKYGFPVLLFGVLMLATPFGAKIWSLMPFVGSTASQSTVEYRQQLWNVSWGVIRKYPLFGHVGAEHLPEMQSLKSDHIVDLVNTYLLVAVEYGLVGLFLFGGFFGSVLVRLRNAYRALGPNRANDVRTGRALFTTMVGLLVVIATVSPIDHMPFLYWSLAGMCVAYTRYLRRSLASAVPK